MTSLAFATDVAARLAEGGGLEHHDGYRLIRTPANSAFRWGNFVLADADADLAVPERWAAVHRLAFPGAGFVTIGVDHPDARVDEAAWRAAGFELDRSVVLTAAAADVARADGEVVRVASDADWADVQAITLEDGPDDDAYAAFASARVRAERTATEAGRAAWLGIRDGGRIVSTLGVLPTGQGTARYQNVGTLAASRRRGFAGRLVRAAAALAAARWDALTLVLVADPDGPAIRLYRGIGFRDVETQLELTRIDPS